MRILVTGGTGFIGSHFLNAACRGGHDVIAIRRPGSNSRVPVAQGVTWIEKRFSGIVPVDCEAVDTVVHFSSHGVSPQNTTWEEAFHHNVIEQLTLVKTCAAGGVSTFVMCGSCFEYGPQAAAFDRIPPDALLRPVGPYAASKAAGGIAAISFAQEANLRMAYLRVFHAFGLGQHTDNFWPSLRTAALAGEDFPMTAGEQVRDFVPVAEVARAFLEVCVSRHLVKGRPEIHNVGSGKPTTLRAFAEQWWREWKATGRLLPGALPYRDGEVMRYVPELTL